MTVARKRALANAVASARMEGLEISEQEKRDCLRYLDGKIDTATLVREALKRQKKRRRESKRRCNRRLRKSSKMKNDPNRSGMQRCTPGRFCCTEQVWAA